MAEALPPARLGPERARFVLLSSESSRLSGGVVPGMRPLWGDCTGRAEFLSGKEEPTQRSVRGRVGADVQALATCVTGHRS